MSSDHDHDHVDRVGTTAEGYPLHGDDAPADDVPTDDAAGEPTDLTAGAEVRDTEIDQVHQRIPDTHQSGF